MAVKQKDIDILSRKPSRANQMRGLQFEKDAIELNHQKRPIESVGREYRCQRCRVKQEVDILFKDGQIAEAKSASLKTVKNKGEQAERLKDLQVWLNCQNGATFKPLAKLDNSHVEVDEVAQKLEGRGFEIERLNTASKR
jgi:hypothetical protein